MNNQVSLIKNYRFISLVAIFLVLGVGIYVFFHFGNQEVIETELKVSQQSIIEPEFSTIIKDSVVLSGKTWEFIFEDFKYSLSTKEQQLMLDDLKRAISFTYQDFELLPELKNTNRLFSIENQTYRATSSIRLIGKQYPPRGLYKTSKELYNNFGSVINYHDKDVLIFSKKLIGKYVDAFKLLSKYPSAQAEMKKTIEEFNGLVKPDALTIGDYVKYMAVDFLGEVYKSQIERKMKEAGGPSAIFPRKLDTFMFRSILDFYIVNEKGSPVNGMLATTVWQVDKETNMISGENGMIYDQSKKRWWFAL